MPDYRCNMLDQRGDVLFRRMSLPRTWQPLCSTPSTFFARAIKARPYRSGFTQSKFGRARTSCSLGNWGH